MYVSVNYIDRTQYVYYVMYRLYVPKCSVNPVSTLTVKIGEVTVVRVPI